nr:hypothetical protein [Tanacetum cinerariifolium]
MLKHSTKLEKRGGELTRQHSEAFSAKEAGVEADLFALKIVCLHYMLRMESVFRANNANVLWCYKNKLELSRSSIRC